jgi:AraC family transcriptional activator of pobA
LASLARPLTRSLLLAMSQKIISLQALAAGPAGVAVFQLSSADLTPQQRAEGLEPHRHDHYSCFLAEQGTVDMRLDFQPLQLAAGSLLVSYPGQVHELDPPQDFRGWMLVADAKLIAPATRSCLEQSVPSPALLQLALAEAAWFRHLFHTLYAAADPQQPSLFHAEVSYALLNACLAQALRLLEARPQQVPAHSRRSVALTRQFRQLLHQHFLTCKKPADYAGQLHVTVSHLNDTVKAVTGFSVSYFIQQQVLAHAQRLLRGTDLPVQEIAGQLGYDDFRYFSRMFAKGAGLSPSLFRKQSLLAQPA